jgi:phospholipid/cholesterol/gamma-HCH transport system permease protein
MKTFFYHCGRIILMIKDGLERPENVRVYWIEFMTQCSDIGIGSLPIVLVISVFMGMVMTVQFAYMMISPFVAKSVIGSLVRDSAILEFSPTILCLVLAGVVGSRITSALGNMRVSEQIDALEVMGVNSITYLVLPKVLSAMIMIPCLIIISIAVSIFGGCLAGLLTRIMTKEQFVQGVTHGFIPYNLFYSIFKAFIFSFFITIVPSYFGYYLQGGAVQIGRASTKAVVVTCILILITDYLISALLL